MKTCRPHRVLSLLAMTTTAVLAFSADVAHSLAIADDKPVQGLYQYKAGEKDEARLEYVSGLPVLTLFGEIQGDGSEIGRQSAALCGEVTDDLLAFPKTLLERFNAPLPYQGLVRMAQKFRAKMPPHQLAELKAIAKATGVSEDELVAANCLPDITRAFGCSSVLIEPTRSATGEMIFGRNLDYFALADLHRFSLVKVYHQSGRHSFVSIGFPGLAGVLSGMNEHGLCLAVHEVYQSADESPTLNDNGIPYTMLYRQVLEECKTVDEAVAMIRKAPRTIRQNLALCDRERAVVCEVTPKTVNVRPAEEAALLCTNHFRTDGLAVAESMKCWRFETMSKSLAEKVTVADVARRLHLGNQGKLTMQTMIFEPKSLRLHLSIGRLPSSGQPLRTMDFQQRLTADSAEEVTERE